MRDAVPLVAEANALSKALGKPVVLSLHLVPLYSMFCFPPTALAAGAGAVAGDQWVEEVPADGLRRRFDREVCVFARVGVGVSAPCLHVVVGGTPGMYGLVIGGGGKEKWMFLSLLFCCHPLPTPPPPPTPHTLTIHSLPNIPRLGRS